MGGRGQEAGRRGKGAGSRGKGAGRQGETTKRPRGRPRKKVTPPDVDIKEQQEALEHIGQTSDEVKEDSKKTRGRPKKKKTASEVLPIPQKYLETFRIKDEIREVFGKVKTYQCDQCNESYGTSLLLGAHRSKHINEAGPNSTGFLGPMRLGRQKGTKRKRSAEKWSVEEVVLKEDVTKVKESGRQVTAESKVACCYHICVPCAPRFQEELETVETI